MSGTLAIARREFASMFRLPVGWVVIALFAFLGSAVFVLTTFHAGTMASMRAFFDVAEWLLLPVVPAVSMRLMAEETRTGSIEPLATAPVSDAAIVVGKYLGGALFFVCLLLPTLSYVGVLWWAGEPKPDAGPIIAGYLSLALLGLVYLSVGLFVSSLTSNQTLAFLGTLFILILWLLAPRLRIGGMPEWAAQGLAAITISGRAREFAKGAVETGDVIVLLLSAGWFVVLAYLAVASRRWR